MPRYCAVKLCTNRGGLPSKDNKRISFYPFPLRDEARLKKWIRNMKRGEWKPSRHQYLCSEHFTDDSFDLRWGIRYLKHTAVPTIFPYMYDSEITNENNSKPAEWSHDGDIQQIRSSTAVRTKPRMLQRGKRGGSLKQTAPVNDRSTQGAVQHKIAVSSYGLNSSFTPSLAEISPTEDLPSLTKSDTKPWTDSVPLAESHKEAITVKQQCSDISVMRFQYSSVTVPLSDPKEEVQHASITDVEVCAEGEPSSQCEHSYSRHDTDKAQLWRKIASLHAKIIALNRQEECTIAKIKSAEQEIEHLKKRNAVCEERTKTLQDYFTSVSL